MNYKTNDLLASITVDDESMPEPSLQGQLAEQTAHIRSAYDSLIAAIYAADSLEQGVRDDLAMRANSNFADELEKWESTGSVEVLVNQTADAVIILRIPQDHDPEFLGDTVKVELVIEDKVSVYRFENHAVPVATRMVGRLDEAA